MEPKYALAALWVAAVFALFLRGLIQSLAG